MSKSSLVNPATPATEKIQVSYDGRQINQLTVITAKLSNTGALPIGGDDEMYPTVKFSKKVIRADTKDPNRRGIKAEAVFNDHSVEIQHGLMNVGDSVPIQILLEGDPGEIAQLPPVLYRVSGIEEPVTRYPSPTRARVGIAYFRFARPVEYFVLAIATLVPLFGIGIFVLGTKETAADMFPERKLSNRIFSSLITLQELADQDSFKYSVAHTLYGHLPFRIADKARDLAMATDMEVNETREGYVERVKKLVTEQVMPTRLSQRLVFLDKQGVLALIAVLACTIACGLIVLGCWQRLLGNY